MDRPQTMFCDVEPEQQQEEKPYTVEMTETAKYVRLSGGYYGGFYIDACTSNCKLNALHSLGSCLRNDEAKTIQAIKELISKDVFFVNLISKNDIDILNKHFTQVYCVKIPLGYNGNYQYHALFQSAKCRGNYRDRFENEGVELV